jgi:RNA polymerase sigma-70 factor (ECF subfamily)
MTEIERSASPGSAEEFGCALETVIPNLRRYARALTRGGADHADDLVQETLCRALKKAHLFAPGSNLRAWVFVLMHNQHVNDVRQGSRMGTQVPVEELEGGGKISELTSGERQTDGLRLRDMRRALDKLPEEQRQTVLLIGLEGMSYGDAARILDIPIGTVRSRLSRARAAMRQTMTGHMIPAASAVPEAAAA